MTSVLGPKGNKSISHIIREPPCQSFLYFLKQHVMELQFTFSFKLFLSLKGANKIISKAVALLKKLKLMKVVGLVPEEFAFSLEIRPSFPDKQWMESIGIPEIIAHQQWFCSSEIGLWKEQILGLIWCTGRTFLPCQSELTAYPASLALGIHFIGSEVIGPSLIEHLWTGPCTQGYKKCQPMHCSECLFPHFSVWVSPEVVDWRTGKDEQE